MGVGALWRGGKNCLDGNGWGEVAHLIPQGCSNGVNRSERPNAQANLWHVHKEWDIFCSACSESSCCGTMRPLFPKGRLVGRSGSGFEERSSPICHLLNLLPLAISHFTTENTGKHWVKGKSGRKKQTPWHPLVERWGWWEQVFSMYRCSYLSTSTFSHAVCWNSIDASFGKAAAQILWLQWMCFLKLLSWRGLSCMISTSKVFVTTVSFLLHMDVVIGLVIILAAVVRGKQWNCFRTKIFYVLTRRWGLCWFF